MKEHYTASISKLHARNRNRVRSIFSGALLSLPIAVSLWYESQKSLLVTFMVIKLHRKERQNVNYARIVIRRSCRVVYPLVTYVLQLHYNCM